MRGEYTASALLKKILCSMLFCAVEKRNIGRSVCPCVPEEDS